MSKFHRPATYVRYKPSNVLITLPVFAALRQLTVVPSDKDFFFSMF